MAHRSDRRGDEPITSLAYQKSRPVDWLPAREFPSWPGQRTAHSWAEDTTAVDLLRLRLSMQTIHSLALLGGVQIVLLDNAAEDFLFESIAE